MPSLPEGLIVVAKRDCPTCQLIEPLLADIDRQAGPLTVYSQDDPTFAEESVAHIMTPPWSTPSV